MTRRPRSPLRGAWLPHRDVDLRERMDDPRCDPVRLRRTYAQFGLMNRLVAGWDAIYEERLRPAARAAAARSGYATLLDVGCGGGDVARRLAVRAARDGLPLRVVGLDPDPRALSFARSRPGPPTLSFVETRAEELVAAGERFDVVVSNHVLHHLSDRDVTPFLATTGRLARRLAVHNDLRRDARALPAFALLSLPFRGSFIAGDGLRSIRRAFTPAEAAALAPAPWRVESRRPFRQLLVLERVVD